MFTKFQGHLFVPLGFILITLVYHIFRSLRQSLEELVSQIRILREVKHLASDSPLLIKINMLKNFKIALFTYIFLPFCFELIAFFFFPKFPWVNDTMSEITWGCLSIILGINYRLRSFAPCYYCIRDETHDVKSVSNSIASDTGMLDGNPSPMIMYQHGLKWRTGMDRPDYLLDSGGWFGSFHEPTQAIIVEEPGRDNFSLAKQLRHRLVSYVPLGTQMVGNTHDSIANNEIDFFLNHPNENLVT